MTRQLILVGFAPADIDLLRNALRTDRFGDLMVTIDDDSATKVAMQEHLITDRNKLEPELLALQDLGLHRKGKDRRQIKEHRAAKRRKI